jgi:retinol dehydrogenase-13
MLKYFKQYKVKDMRDMLRNEKKDPLVCNQRCEGTYVAITGATAGIGREAAIIYAEMGARLLLINRNEEKSKQLCRELSETYGTDCQYIIADFTHLDQVKEAAVKIREAKDLPDIFINNTGVFHTKLEFTDDGLESVFQINFLGAFIFTHMLRDAYIKKGKGRIIYVNSEGHRFCPERGTSQ